jgi:hypothetical protein
MIWSLTVPRDLTIADLQRAENSLAMDMATWRTDTLEYVLGLRCATSSNVPISSRSCFSTLWWYLKSDEATALLQHLAAQVMATRSVVEYRGKCPRCGAGDATIKDYDGGRYQRAEHASKPVALGYGTRTGLGYVPSRMECYIGPSPLPERYEGDQP